MKYEVLITASAEADLAAAYSWLSAGAEEAAIKWYNGVLDALLTLETLPERCPLLGGFPGVAGIVIVSCSKTG